ncbi:hypothetical protein ACFYXQ_09205 [Nocardia jiangxiensis]|uniref:Chromosome segregation ATPase n=1 Tax=Nocardia jiangxiensis TaxID=282685 RepID=A0ABW6RVA9_9NOCA
MYELNRVRLFNIGPTKARYDDVLLDLSEGGPSIPVTTLTPLAGQVFRRPALASLLVLENGGGKSVFIRMLLATVLPERQSRKGRDALRAYVVSAASPSHVVLEWVHVRTGRILLTGQVLAPGSSGKPDRLFYSLTPRDTTALEMLPFADGRRRLPMNAYHDALRRLDTVDKSLRLEVEKGQRDWENHLRRLGLESDLFAVQQAMNVDEGDAAEAFKTTSGRQFVEWLLSKTLDAENFAELGKAYTAYAKNIGRREQMLLDRDFSLATATAAGNLATCRAEQVAAIEVADVAATDLARLAAAVRESVQRSEELLRDRREDLMIAKATAGERGKTRDAAVLTDKEVRRRTSVLRRDEAVGEAKRIEGKLAEARAELAGWTLVPKVLEVRTARERYRVASDLLKEREEVAGIAQARRDRAGAAFAGALQGAVRRCAGQAEELLGKESSDNEAAAENERRASEDEREDTSKTVRAGLLAGQVEEIDAHVRQARARGVLEQDETVAEAAERLRRHAEDCAGEVIREQEAHRQLGLEVRRLDEAAQKLIEPEVRARQDVEGAVQAVQEMDTAARTLTEDTLLRELAELDAGEDVPGGDPATWLEANAAALVDLAAAAQGSAAARLDALTAENRADERLINALTVEDDALMPPRDTVERVLEILADQEIIATAGWRALEQLVNPGRHAETIQTHPAVVDGVVVADPAMLDRARQILADARPLPASAVLVTTAESLHAPTEALNGFVVEPTPALHDPVAAAELREQAQARIDNRSHALADLGKRRSAAFTLGTRLETWLRDHPAGAAGQLRSAIETASTAAAQAKTALDTARAAHTQAVQDLDQHSAIVTATEETVDAATRLSESVKTLAAEVAKAARHRGEIASLTAEAEGHRAAAKQYRIDAAKLRARATEHAVRAESLRRDGDLYANQLKKIVVGDQPLATDFDESDLAALEISYQEASEAFRAVEVGRDLRQMVSDAQKEVQDLDAHLRGEPAEIVARAEALAAVPEAGNPASIEAMKRQFGRTEEALNTESGTLLQRIGELKAQTAALTQRNGLPWTDLDGDWTPSDPAHGDMLADRARLAMDAAQAECASASEAQQTAERKLRKAESWAREMDGVLRGLNSATRKLELPSGVGPFTGTADEAQNAADKTTRAHGDATDRLHEAGESANAAVVDFRETANQNRFTRLTAPIYKQLTDIDKESLIERADQWATQLTSRAASLTTDLEDSERHRTILINQLQHHVGEALTLVEKAERLSRLPDSAGVWAGRRVLKIGFAKPDPQILVARIAETVDENARSRPDLPGRDLVLRCVAGAVPRDFKVEILKPDAAGRAEYASISQMATVFSGGQELTGAIMLYCTLAALRASTRAGSRGSRAGGMLILDNPIGKASADYLLSLQMNMAAAVGVQLIYTTGSMEDRVLATFPLCIRLRNDADQRSGLQHLHVIDRVVDGTPMDDDPVHGRLTAARLLRKPRPADTALEPDGHVRADEDESDDEQ